MATIDDILNALRGQGYADGSTWMQQPQTQPDGPPMPAGMPTQLPGGQPPMPRHHAPRRPDNIPSMDPAQFERELAMAAYNNQPQIGQTPIVPPHMQQANLGQIVPQSSAPAVPSGMIGWRARMQPTLADLAPNTLVASNGFAPFNGRY